MRRSLLLACVLLMWSGSGFTQQLSEAQKLRAENLQLRIQIAQLKATLADREQRLRIYDLALGQGVTAEAQKDSVALSAEQTKLIEEFRTTLKAASDAEFDWSTLTFKTFPSKAATK